jgi:hypothetical protein
MHREEQIIQAAKAAIEAQSVLAAAVFTHRTLTLSADDQELPAVVVNNGADAPPDGDGVTNLAFIDSVLELQISLAAQGDTQQEIASELDRLRVAVHKALMTAPRTLGLSFVMGIRYGGAEAPEYSTTGSPLAGKRACAFSFHYRMDIDDPE